MDNEPITSQEQKTPADFDFEYYRSVCDAHTEGARRLGLLDKELAETALRDPRTIVVTIDGIKFPVLVPIEYAEGYDAERTKQIVTQNGKNAEEVYYYALPADMASTDIKSVIAELLKAQKPHDICVFFDYDAKQSLVKTEFEALISTLGKEVSSIPLFDHTVGDKEHNLQAALELYVTSVRQIEQPKAVGADPTIYSQFRESVESGEYELLPENGASLLKGSDIPGGLREKMWQLYLDRFQDLGEYHPIVMEEARSGFEAKLDNPDTTFSVYFVDGEPVCWMCFLTDMDQCDWLNPKFFNAENLEIADDESLLFFPEIVARADGIGGYSRPTLQLATEFAFRTGKNYKVCFESTNRSKEYIPALVKQYAEETGKLTVSEPKRVDVTLYACYSISNG